MKPGQSALDTANPEPKFNYAERLGRDLLDPKSARGENTTRRIEELKNVWKLKDTSTPYADQRQSQTDS